MGKPDKTIQIEEGKHYIRRDGVKVGPMLKSRSGSHPFYPEGKAETYTESGFWLNNYSKMPDDLVREAKKAGKMKRGPKPGNRKKLTVAVSIDITLKADIESRTENLSGFLNEAGKAFIPRWDRRAKAEGTKP